MADPNNASSDWHTPAFRSRVVAQIEDSMRHAPTPMGRSSVEMENHVYQKAQTREEYLALVARLILHVKDHIAKGRAQARGMNPGVGMPQHTMGGTAGPLGIGDQAQGAATDPMNALQNLARQGGQPPQQGMMGAQHAMHAAAQHRQPTQQQQAVMMQQRGQMQQRPQLQRQDAFIVTSPQNIQPMQGQGIPSTSASMNFQQNTNTFPMTRPMASVQQQSPYMQPSSQQSMVSMGSEPSPAQNSPAPALPSPSPQPQSQIVPSPVSRGMMGAPSPGTILNTPGNPVSSVPSPSGAAPHSSAEEQAYLEKLGMLSKYIEPLRRSVNSLEKNKDEDSKKNYMKMKNLLDILTDPNKRVSMTMLVRCEQALNNWQMHSKPSSASSSGVSSSGLIGQSLVDAIAANIKSPALNHTLHRTFGPAMSALMGERIRAPSPPTKRLRMEEREKEEGLPHMLQNEIAMLGSRFRVSLDPLHHHANKTAHLVCKLDDEHLPSVPPVLITVPSDYPKSSPMCDPKACPGYDASDFFENIAEVLTQMTRRMSNNFTLTSLLNAWEMSVRKVCGPPTTGENSAGF
ncbi:mediator of RNA polymerase II transcription subunit 15-like [Pomacea canaliculata]|uniref:mediator of RNA polymerase II transcription subunit 15-like n=1 Tax=Pomacea canaliculata TaxID=400727 RepID=UPI000D72BF8A|nr:mediator of RNA polymerase II transcription subunit 15-like [Pomacea canaliculata]